MKKKKSNSDHGLQDVFVFVAYIKWEIGVYKKKNVYDVCVYML